MGNDSFFIKGDRENILQRIVHVHTITIYCPLDDDGVLALWESLGDVAQRYRTDMYEWKNVPTFDALNAFIFLSKNCEVDDKGIIGIIVSSLKMFNRLKYINFSFTDNPEIKESYDSFLNRRNGKKGYIYKVDRLELNLSEMFSQWVIDLLNRVFICNEIIPNSYLERKFCIDFTYDEYMNFMDMFLTNNGGSFNSLDKNICEYFKSFPTLINEQKPNIRLITNYSDEVTV